MSLDGGACFGSIGTTADEGVTAVGRVEPEGAALVPAFGVRGALTAAAAPTSVAPFGGVGVWGTDVATGSDAEPEVGVDGIASVVAATDAAEPGSLGAAVLLFGASTVGVSDGSLAKTKTMLSAIRSAIPTPTEAASHMRRALGWRALGTVSFPSACELSGGREVSSGGETSISLTSRGSLGSSVAGVAGAIGAGEV